MTDDRNLISRRVQFWTACALIAVGCALLTAGFVVPPPGQIHHSVLVAFGEILTFIGSLFGVDYRYRFSGGR